MIPESITTVIARNERWSGAAATEPLEAGWAREAVIFLRALKVPVGPQPVARVEISPDGMHWLPEGSEVAMPAEKDGLVAARVAHFGNWLRVIAQFAPGSEATVLVSVHLKA
jgi:hypothetical protein